MGMGDDAVASSSTASVAGHSSSGGKDDTASEEGGVDGAGGGGGGGGEEYEKPDIAYQPPTLCYLRPPFHGSGSSLSTSSSFDAASNDSQPAATNGIETIPRIAGDAIRPRDSSK